VETAIRLYLQGGLPAKAAALAQNPNYPQTPEMLETIAAALSKCGLHEKAGSFMEKLGMAERALESYRKGNAYRRAVEVCLLAQQYALYGTYSIVREHVLW